MRTLLRWIADHRFWHGPRTTSGRLGEALERNGFWRS